MPQLLKNNDPDDKDHMSNSQSNNFIGIQDKETNAQSSQSDENNKDGGLAAQVQKEHSQTALESRKDEHLIDLSFSKQNIE